MRLFLLLFITVPLIEIYLLIRVGKMIGGFNTVALVVLTAAIGLALLRAQGQKALMTARSKMEQGTLPAKEMAEGVFMAVGGALLLTPGFATDFLGFCCLIPGLRRALIAWGIQRVVARGQFSASYTYTQDPRHNRKFTSHQVHRETNRSGRIIEGEAEEVDGKRRDDGE